VKRVTIIFLICLGILLALPIDFAKDVTPTKGEMMPEPSRSMQTSHSIIVTEGRAWNTLLSANFESGMPAGWTVIDGNGDGYMWVTGTTSDLGSYQPPNYGTAYAYYSDDDAGMTINYNEELISPSLRIPSAAESLRISYGFGFRLYQTGEKFRVKIRKFSGGSWTPWTDLVVYSSSISGTANFNLTSYLPADSVQFDWFFSDSTSTDHWGWACATDNVKVEYFLQVAHDVGAIAIMSPPGQIGCSDTVPITGIVGNVGQNAETFNAYFVIDSAGTPIYNQSVTGITLPVGVQDTIQFPNWYPPHYPGNYGVTFYVVLSGDLNPANDTLRNSTIANAWIWEPLPDMPDIRMIHATVYNPDNDRVYVIGGTITGQTTDQQNQCWEYDPVANTWNTKATMLVARSWIAGVYNSGKIYVPSGYFSGGGTNNFQTYDVAGNTWANLANLPLNRLAYGIAYWNGFVYVVGGYDGSAWQSSVLAYSVANNAWYSATTLPANCGMNAVTQRADTIFIVGGYNGSACWSNLYKGIIQDSTTINWTSSTALPVPNFNNGCGASGQYVLTVGGFLNAAIATNDAWVYDGTSWTQLPDIPGGVRVRNNFATGAGPTSFYACGGDNTGGWTACRLAYRLVYSPPGGAISEDKRNEVGSSIRLSFANPVKEPKISFSLAKATDCRIELFDITGRKIERLFAGHLNAGNHTCTIKSPLARGIYFVRLETADKTITGKLILVR